MLEKTIVWPAKIQASVRADLINDGFYIATVTMESHKGNQHKAEAIARSVDRAIAFAMQSLAYDLIKMSNSSD